MAEQTPEKDATIYALVEALKRVNKRQPTIPIGTRVRVAKLGVGTVVGTDGVGFDGVSVIFDRPVPRGFERGCCAGVEDCEVLTPTPRLPDHEHACASGGYRDHVPSAQCICICGERFDGRTSSLAGGDRG